MRSGYRQAIGEEKIALGIGGIHALDQSTGRRSANLASRVKRSHRLEQIVFWSAWRNGREVTINENDVASVLNDSKENFRNDSL
jgi:hypothetical protein